MVRVLLMYVFLRKARGRWPEMFDGAAAARSVNEAIAAWIEEERLSDSYLYEE